MAKKSKNINKDVQKIRQYIFIDILLIIIAIFLFDTLGFINIKEIVTPIVSSIPGLDKINSGNVEDPYLLSREEHKKESYTLKIREEKLKQKEEDLKVKESELMSKIESLKSEKEDLKKEKENLKLQRNEYNDYKKNIAKQAEYIESMRPEDSVARLKEMDDLTVIDIFREMDNRAKQEGRQSIVSYLLSLLDPKRSAIIQKKMLLNEEE